VNLASLNGNRADVDFAIGLEKRGLFTGKRSPRLMQRQNKAMRKAGISWTDIDRAFAASGSLMFNYREEKIEHLSYPRNTFFAMLPKKIDGKWAAA